MAESSIAGDATLGLAVTDDELVGIKRRAAVSYLAGQLDPAEEISLPAGELARLISDRDVLLNEIERQRGRRL